MTLPVANLGQIPTTDADSSALPQTPVLPHHARRRATIFALAGVLAYCAGLIATIPASLVLPKSDRWQIGGTIWNGEAVVAGTTRIAWQWSPLASLRHFGFAADWHMTGGATDLAGTATPGIGRFRLDGVSGVVDGNLLETVAPNLPVTCRFLAQVNLDTVIVGGDAQQIAGSLRSSPVRCTAKALAAAALDLPALHGTISAAHGLSSGALFTLPARQHLVELRLSASGAFSLWPTAALTARSPALAGIRYDTALRW